MSLREKLLAAVAWSERPDESAVKTELLTALIDCAVACERSRLDFESYAAKRQKLERPEQEILSHYMAGVLPAMLVQEQALAALERAVGM